jgi:hypothetical protein
MITLNKLIEKYGYGENYFRTLLCRPEFNQFRAKKNFYIMDGSDNFYKVLEHIIKLKKVSNKNWRTNYAILFMFVLLNIQPVWCQRYEPVIIYDPYGVPQGMIKTKIIKNIKYSIYGLCTK